MSEDELAKTLIIPNPGGRRKSAEPETDFSQTGHFKAPPSPFNENEFTPQIQTGENAILSVGSELLTLASHLRALEPTNPVEHLRQDVEKLLASFETKLTEQSVSKEVVLTGRYIICCLLDEMVLSTPWGAESIWSQQTLLSKYHNETWGGEKFFLIVQKLLELPERNIDLLELCYVCLSSGFMGKYRVAQQGENEVFQMSQTLAQQIERVRPTPNELSLAWKGVGNTGKKLTQQFRAWIAFLLFAVICLMMYVGMLSSLNAKVEPIYQKLSSIGWDDFVLKMNESQPEPLDVNTIADTVRSDLKVEIDSQMLAIDVRDNMLIVRLMNTSLFPSGSSVVNEDVLPNVEKLVGIIQKYADSILVVGHTDSTGKADSNWVISRKRAQAISQWLEKGNYPVSKMITRGVADTQPLFSDDQNNKYNQSMNRRVELILVLKAVGLEGNSGRG